MAALYWVCMTPQLAGCYQPGRDIVTPAAACWEGDSRVPPTQKGTGNLNHEIFFFPERRRLHLILWEGDLASIRKQSRPVQMLWSPGRWPLGPTQKKPVCRCWRGGRRCGSPSFPISPFLFCPQEEQGVPGG